MPALGTCVGTAKYTLPAVGWEEAGVVDLALGRLRVQSLG